MVVEGRVWEEGGSKRVGLRGRRAGQRGGR